MAFLKSFGIEIGGYIDRAKQRISTGYDRSISRAEESARYIEKKTAGLETKTIKASNVMVKKYDPKAYRRATEYEKEKLKKETETRTADFKEEVFTEIKAKPGVKSRKVELVDGKWEVTYKYKDGSSERIEYSQAAHKPGARRVNIVKSIVEERAEPKIPRPPSKTVKKIEKVSEKLATKIRLPDPKSKITDPKAKEFIQRSRESLARASETVGAVPVVVEKVVREPAIAPYVAAKLAHDLTIGTAKELWKDPKQTSLDLVVTAGLFSAAGKVIPRRAKPRKVTVEETAKGFTKKVVSKEVLVENLLVKVPAGVKRRVGKRVEPKKKKVKLIKEPSKLPDLKKKVDKKPPVIDTQPLLDLSKVDPKSVTIIDAPKRAKRPKKVIDYGEVIRKREAKLRKEEGVPTKDGLVVLQKQMQKQIEEVKTVPKFKLYKEVGIKTTTAATKRKAAAATRKKDITAKRKRLERERLERIAKEKSKEKAKVAEKAKEKVKVSEKAKIKAIPAVAFKERYVFRSQQDYDTYQKSIAVQKQTQKLSTVQIAGVKTSTIQQQKQRLDSVIKEVAKEVEIAKMKPKKKVKPKEKVKVHPKPKRAVKPIAVVKKKDDKKKKKKAKPRKRKATLWTKKNPVPTLRSLFE